MNGHVLEKSVIFLDLKSDIVYVDRNAMPTIRLLCYGNKYEISVLKNWEKNERNGDTWIFINYSK